MEIQSLISNLQNVFDGTPWYGRPVYDILQEIDPKKTGSKPHGSGHSMLELAYHMLTWAEFNLNRIQGIKEDMDEFEKLDWRPLDPSRDTWQKGIAALKETHDKIIELLKQKKDDFLEEQVDYRNYNFRFMLNGLAQHNIYHLAQIAYINKFLV